jgi:hypothetical protein
VETSLGVVSSITPGSERSIILRPRRRVYGVVVDAVLNEIIIR